MNSEEIKNKWNIKHKRQNANIDLWNFKSEYFNKKVIPSFENDNILKILEGKNMIKKEDIVLDLGCGTGKYTIAISPKCKHIVGIDLSSKMIEFGIQNMNKYNIKNSELFCCDWFDVNIDDMKFENKFDLVFANMTPAIQSADTFEKMNKCSRRYCIMSKPTRKRDKVLDEVYKLVDINEKLSTYELDMMYAFNLLLLEGYNPEIIYKEETWSRVSEINAFYEDCINWLNISREVSNEEKIKVRKYLEEISIDGYIKEESNMTIMTLIWSKLRIVDNKKSKI